MNAIERNVLIRHFNRYFEQDNGFILQTKNTNPRIDGLLCAPNEKYPYWKLATLGASDYKMPAPKDSLGSRNEYVMFIDAEEDLTRFQNALVGRNRKTAYYFVGDKENAARVKEFLTS